MGARERRVRRSVLFVPGNRSDRHEKAMVSGADVAVLDLEDAVPVDQKQEARMAVRESLRMIRDVPAERVARINPIGQGDMWKDDLAALVPAQPDAIMVPKAEEARHVVDLAARLDALESASGAPPGRIKLHLICETALGVLQALELARASPRVEVLLFGAEDLAADIGGRRTPGSMEVLYARSRVALAAGAAKVDAIDMVFTKIDDADSLRDEAAFARNLGYRGKMAIHPKQLAPIHDAFTPTKEETAHAVALLAAVAEAGAGAGGVVKFEGRMVDRPLIEQARYVKRLAEHAGSV